MCSLYIWVCWRQPHFRSIINCPWVYFGPCLTILGTLLDWKNTFMQFRFRQIFHRSVFGWVQRFGLIKTSKLKTSPWVLSWVLLLIQIDNTNSYDSQPKIKPSKGKLENGGSSSLQLKVQSFITEYKKEETIKKKNEKIVI